MESVVVPIHIGDLGHVQSYPLAKLSTICQGMNDNGPCGRLAAYIIFTNLETELNICVVCDRCYQIIREALPDLSPQGMAN